MNNQDPKFSALLTDYTNMKTILDPKLRTQDRKQAQTPAGTSSGLFMIHDTGRPSYPMEESLTRKEIAWNAHDHMPERSFMI